MTSTALATIDRQMTPPTWQMIQQIAPTMKDARLFGVASTEAAAAIMIKGFELGFSLSSSFENIVVIEGKAALVPKGALALIHASPELAGIKITDDANGCTVWMKRRNGFEYTSTFTLEDAKRAGLVKADSGWAKYPGNMCRWRAIGFCADIVFPDVIGGTKRADEYGADLTPDGNVIEGSWAVQGSQQPQAAPLIRTFPGTPTATVIEPTYDQNRWAKLVADYNAGTIIDANGGKIPGTNEELDAIEAHLGVARDK